MNPANPDLKITFSNPRAERMAKVRALAGNAVRKREGRFLVEGPQAVREAVRFAAVSIRDVYLTPDAGTRYPEILAEAREAGLHVHGSTAEVVAAMSGDAQGVLAVANLPEPTLEGSVRERARLVAMLSNVRDPGNVGTIIRVADAAGADAVVLVGECVDPYSPKVVRASAGSLFHLPVVTEVSLGDAMARAREAGLRIYAASGSGSDDLFTLAEGADAPLAQPIAWVFGNEAWGLSPEEIASADRSVRLPILGAAESLNVAAAVSVALYFCAHARQRDTRNPE
jgi:TrmH family RNA methyltransferase